MGKKAKKEAETPCKEPFEPLPVEGKTPETVVLLLSSPEEDILVKACEAIHTFAEKGDDNKVSLLGLGALEPLCKLISNNNRLVRRNAFMALGIMATNGEVKSALKKKDVIPSIIDKLSLEGPAPLIQLLSSPDPDVKNNSLEIIFNLVQSSGSPRVGRDPSTSGTVKVRLPCHSAFALKTLQNVTTDAETCNTFREEQGFEKLMEILSNTDFSDLHAGTLQVVANCLSDSESLQLIHKDGGLKRLMEFVLTPNTPDIQSNTVKCITRVAHSCKHRRKQEVFVL
ncbi:hypothetical protein F7725_028572 [Dissostichus mawsoni]|uniref:Armadillo repeat containing 3 n=1 Tax=Dissostichus mawsoni TaxID=36200 RepID=A0A7J5XG50_DISMA|nr:hypothetical protein F7725_028572 [Dissostichus mawsoni]